MRRGGKRAHTGFKRYRLTVKRRRGAERGYRELVIVYHATAEKLALLADDIVRELEIRLAALEKIHRDKRAVPEKRAWRESSIAGRRRLIRLLRSDPAGVIAVLAAIDFGTLFRLKDYRALANVPEADQCDYIGMMLARDILERIENREEPRLRALLVEDDAAAK